MPGRDPIVVGTLADKTLLIIRLALAIVFLYHGSQILFGAFGGPGLSGFSAFTHMPQAMAVLVAVGEFGGGLAMLLGLFSRLGALGIIVIMAGAILTVHLKHGLDVQKGGFEYALVLLMAALAILIDGPGLYSIASRLPGIASKI